MLRVPFQGNSPIIKWGDFPMISITSSKQINSTFEIYRLWVLLQYLIVKWKINSDRNNRDGSTVYIAITRRKSTLDDP